jgi:hypothetical protein
MRDLSLLGDGAMPKNNVHFFVDDDPFERWGTLNVRDVQRRKTASMAMRMSFDVFQQFARATTIRGDAFGVDFTIASDQIVLLRDAADRWSATRF